MAFTFEGLTPVELRDALDFARTRGWREPTTALNALGVDAHKIERDHGFWDDQGALTDASKIALMHSELSEALEAVRDENFHGDHGVCEELADVIIRIAGYSSARGLDLDAAVAAKMERNRNRPFKHGRKAAL